MLVEFSLARRRLVTADENYRVTAIEDDSYVL